jgi:hypothetical protein
MSILHQALTAAHLLFSLFRRFPIAPDVDIFAQ